MRKSCYGCVIKHLGSAAVFIKETAMGYPDYDIYAIGELEHAADECLQINKDLADVIREHRLMWTSNHDHSIPFEDINRYVKCCILAKKSDIDTPAIPEELVVGLPTIDGKLDLHGDTRP